MSMPTEGQKAPEFRLNDQDGKTHRLKGYEGKHVILYFYPRDDTPGCTKEACGFRDNWEQFKKRGAIILGVSADNEESHKKFANKYSLPFPLLADTDKKVCEAYGVWQQKSMYGRLFMGIQRATFLIGPDGKIEKAFPKVKPAQHAEEILALI